MPTEIDLYTWTTPNGMKPAIALKLMQLPHRVIPVELGPKAPPRSAAFLATSATGKIPAIHDPDTGISLAESGAILMYLAEKTGSPLLPPSGAARAGVLQWLFAASATFTPALNEGRFYFVMHRGESPLAEQRLGSQIRRSYEIAEAALSKTAYLAGDDLSLADIALWPYVARFGWQNIALTDYPAVRAWYQRLAALRAFASGFDVLGKGEAPPQA